MRLNNVSRVLRDVNVKLDAILARLEALEERIVEGEKPELEDLEAYEESERELREGKLIPLKKS